MKRNRRNEKNDVFFGFVSHQRIKLIGSIYSFDTGVPLSTFVTVTFLLTLPRKEPV